MFRYVALGHLHRPQALGGGRVRYSGSCFPLSAAEVSYDHGVTIIDLDGDALRVAHHAIPRPAAVHRLPLTGAMPFDALEGALTALEADPDAPVGLRPLVYVTLEATGPSATLLADAERLLAAAPVRTAGVRIQRAVEAAAAAVPGPAISLAETTPEALFRDAFLTANGVPPEARHLAAFRDVAGEG